MCISCSQRPDGAPRLNFPVGVRRAVHMPPQAVARARRGETLPVACIRRPSARRGEQKIRPNRPGRHRRKPQERRAPPRIAITRPSSATFLPRTPPSSYPIPTPYYSPVRPREDIPDARFLLRPTWVAPAREMPASCSPTRSFFRPPVVALGSHLAPLLAPSSPARRSGLATLPGQGAAVLGPTSPRRCRGEEGSSRGFSLF